MSRSRSARSICLSPPSVDRDLIRGLVAARARKVLSNLIEEDIVTLLPALAGLVQFPLREGASIFGAHFVTEFAMKQIGGGARR